MNRVLGVAAALFALCSIGAPAVAQEDEPTITLALSHAHAPTFVATEAWQLFHDVNATRAAHGLPALVQDRRLDMFAWYLGQDMVNRRYFGHTDPDGITFEQRIKSSGIPYRTAGENIAFDQNEARANIAFNRSREHFENIVDPNVRRMGIAVVAAGDGEIFYVEEFAG